MKLVFDQMAILSGLLWVFLLIALGLTACEPGPATEADIQRMKDDVASEVGDVASFKSEWRQTARSQGQSWDTIEAVAEAIGFEAYTVCFTALVHTAIDDVVETNPGANIRTYEKASLGVFESFEYQAKLADCVEASLD